MRALWLGLVAACSGPDSGEPPPSAPRPPPVDVGSAVFLDRLSPTAITVAPNSRPELPAAVPVTGPFRYAGVTRAGMHRWIAPFPARARGLFFHKAEDGMALNLDGAALAYDRHGKHDAPTWVHDRRELTVFTPTQEPPPTGDRLTLVWPTALDRERQLNLSMSGLAADRFVQRSVQLDWDTRSGLLLPAPSSIAYTVAVPPAAELHFAAGIVPPEVTIGPPSTGAGLVVQVDGAAVARLPLDVGVFPQHSVDLSAFAGREITLTLSTEPCRSGPCPADTADALLDYVFVAEPALASRLSAKRRVVLVFVDTLRPDHLSLYGYHRDTSAPIDERFADAAVFTEARTVAPWTLPSARSALTGRHPEAWGDATTLADVFHAHGEPTAFFSGNIYLSSQFDMDRGWDLHHVELWPSADEVTDRALGWLAEHEGRGGLLQVHYMDPHLPYLEPASHRTRYAAAAIPDGLRDQFHLSDLRQLSSVDDTTKQWVRDRYDNNIRYTADAIARLLDALRPDDVVVLYSDHGEEFYDHGGIEHGHALWDELLRVPLAVRAPGMPSGQIGEAVSLLDIAPTVLELAGLPPIDGADGRSLVPLARRDDDAVAAFTTRDLGFGRMLYGSEAWGVVSRGEKYFVRDGQEAVYNLAVDPGETTNLVLQAPGTEVRLRERLASGVGADVAVGWRFVPSAPRADDPPVEAICSFPGALRHVVVSEDPLGNGAAAADTISGDEATKRLADWGADAHTVRDGDVHLAMRWWGASSREVVVEPEGALAELGHDVQCTARSCVKVPNAIRECPLATVVAEPHRETGFGVLRTPLAHVGWGKKRMFTWSFGIVPVLGSGQATDGSDDEMKGALEAIGYVETEP